MYYGNSSCITVITQIRANLEASIFAAKAQQFSSRGTSPNYAWNKGGVAVFSRKHAMSEMGHGVGYEQDCYQ